ncbi:MAG: PQQ-dependent sugar dehydrogenase, partial [Verrucomicrobia bacterium]|nr:PQQ-dependent sugar dehydrogenase [Verrucomicrobiota bacterium]
NQMAAILRTAIFCKSCLIFAGWCFYLFAFVSIYGQAAKDSERLAWDNSHLQGSPEPPPPFVAVRAFPELAFKSPAAIELEPGRGRILFLETYDQEDKNNTLKCFNPGRDVSESETLLEIPGLAYDITFHPRYEENGFLYLGIRQPGPDGNNHARIVRYTVDQQAPHHLVGGSAFTIIEWPSDGHNGSAICFGNDGMFYVTSGDGTSLMDLDLMGQNLTTLLSKVLRLDVDGAPPGQPYRVPEDNPFVGIENIRPETWAYGLRNPWRITNDPESGQIWVGQNGQDLRESAHLLERGANYGWSAYEGSREFMIDRLRGPSPFTPPTIEHDHSEFRSLTGGFVYRGKRFPDLIGAYIYGDYGTGRIWAAKHDGKKLLWNREIADTTMAIADFGTTLEGDILVVDHLGDDIYRLEPRSSKEKDAPKFPTKLSQTGLFASTAELVPAEGVLPYKINAPAWHDGAEAERLLALPGKTKAEFQEEDSERAPWSTWNFPNGTAVAQTLVEPESKRRLETRVLLKQENEWAAYSYLWNNEQNDAELAPKEGTRIEVEGREWLVPSRTECLFCHSRAANFVLGLTNAQLNREGVIGGKQENQLEALARLGFVHAPKPDGGFSATLPTPPAEMARLVDPYDQSATTSDRIRAYFATNCVHCHIPNAGGNTKMNLGPWVKSEDQHLINAPPEHGNFGLEEARLIVPGDPGLSMLPIRVTLRGTGQMPPVGTLYSDIEGIRLLYEWQESLVEPDLANETEDSP